MEKLKQSGVIRAVLETMESSESFEDFDLDEDHHSQSHVDTSSPQQMRRRASSTLSRSSSQYIPKRMRADTTHEDEDFFSRLASILTKPSTRSDSVDLSAPGSPMSSSQKKLRGQLDRMDSRRGFLEARYLLTNLATGMHRPKMQKYAGKMEPPSIPPEARRSLSVPPKARPETEGSEQFSGPRMTESPVRRHAGRSRGSPELIKLGASGIKHKGLDLGYGDSFLKEVEAAERMLKQLARPPRKSTVMKSVSVYGRDDPIDKRMRILRDMKSLPSSPQPRSPSPFSPSPSSPSPSSPADRILHPTARAQSQPAAPASSFLTESMTPEARASRQRRHRAREQTQSGFFPTEWPVLKLSKRHQPSGEHSVSKWEYNHRAKTSLRHPIMRKEFELKTFESDKIFNRKNFAQQESVTMAKIHQIKAHPSVVDKIEKIWDELSGNGCNINKNTYVDFHERMYYHILEKEDKAAAQQSALDDWEVDKDDFDLVRKDKFVDIMLELSHNWTWTFEPEEYTEFFKDTLRMLGLSSPQKSSLIGPSFV